MESMWSRQVHGGASPPASAPTDTLFVGRAVSAVTRPPAERTNPVKGGGPLETGCDTHTHTWPHSGAHSL